MVMVHVTGSHPSVSYEQDILIYSWQAGYSLNTTVIIHHHPMYLMGTSKQLISLH